MLAYVPANRVAARAGSPRTLLFVIAGHAALLAVIITARSELPNAPPFIPTVIDFIDPPKPPPPPPPPEPSQPRSDTPSRIDTPATIVPIPQPAPPLDRGPPIRDTTPLIGTAVVPIPVPFDPPAPVLVRQAARFITPADEVRPPYPASKRELEQEASLRLALTIDASGRVTSVEPVGAADRTFLDAARRHIVRRWRYTPATEGGTAIASRIVVTLRFELEE